MHSVSFAAEVVILYTGSTHAMLYPCNCLKEPDGGVTRRATLVAQMREKYPRLLLLDAGNFFAGGSTDEYSQNAELDGRRSLINLKAMELMQYDAAAIQDNEFNFGKEFIRENIALSKIPFLSANIDMEGVRPYLLKDAGGVKVGIAGVSSLASSAKAAGLKLADFKKSTADAIKALKNAGAEIIVLLSGLGPEADRELLNSAPGIDIVISSAVPGKESASEKIGNTLYLVPSWQGRKISKLSLTVGNKKIVKSEVEDIRLSDKIAPDPAVQPILPLCFSDANCSKDGRMGTCSDPGRMSASCSFEAVKPVRLLIVSARACRVCEYSTMTDFLKRNFAGLKVTYLYYPDARAKELLSEFSITAVPAYLLGKEAEKEASFSGLSSLLSPKGDYYMLKPEFSGFSYFTERKKIPGSFDLFISLFDKHTAGLLDVVRDFRPRIHFLAVERGLQFVAPAGKMEIEEDLRALCVRKLYPKKFWDYISCRAENTDSSWWEDCAADMDPAAVKACAKSSGAAELLKADIALNREFSLMRGPTYLLDNNEIFSTNGVPDKDELEKLIKR